MLRVGDWCVQPASGQISRDGESVRVEERAMRLLLCLAEHPGEVVSIDDLLNQVWADVTVSQDSVYQAVASLRRLLGDDPKQPTYIATVPRLGYRMVAKVSPWEDSSVEDSSSAKANTVRASDEGPASSTSDGKIPTSRANGAREMGHPARLRIDFKWAVGVMLCLAIAAFFLFRSKVGNNDHSSSVAVAAQPQKSVAVLPFLDLTEGMKEEEFADGMTEELIDRISKIPGTRVPPPTSSFYFKGKQVPVAEIAKSLSVAYVLDGSVRKSGNRLRVAARLIRAENGYVVWSEDYDRPLNDILMVQDDIAGEVTKALKASIEGGAEH
jgi:transcriptional activator of cad operon